MQIPFGLYDCFQDVGPPRGIVVRYRDLLVVDRAGGLHSYYTSAERGDDSGIDYRPFGNLLVYNGGRLLLSKHLDVNLSWIFVTDDISVMLTHPRFEAYETKVRELYPEFKIET